LSAAEWGCGSTICISSVVQGIKGVDFNNSRLSRQNVAVKS